MLSFSGIGQAVSVRLAIEGAKVFILDMLDGTATVNKIKEISYRNSLGCEYVKMDVTNHEEVKKCIDSIIQKYGRIDALVQCAGITGKTGLKAHEVDGADFERVWR